MLYITFVFIFKVLHNWTIFFLNEHFHVEIFSDTCICYFFVTQNDGLLLLSVLLHMHVSLDDHFKVMQQFKETTTVFLFFIFYFESELPEWSE